MTVMTKPDIAKSPLVLEDKIEINTAGTDYKDAKWHFSTIVTILLMTLCVVGVGALSSAILYQESARDAHMREYHGFCTVGMPKDDQFLSVGTDNDDSFLTRQMFRKNRLPQMQVFSAADDDSTAELMNALKEKLDISDNVEKIVVLDDGQKFNFVNDFNNNISGIIDEERCFVMDLNRDMALAPDSFVLGIESGDRFDVSKMNSALHAVLPALHELTRKMVVLAHECSDKPTYRLEETPKPTIRKRSTDTPEPKYRQFSGKHIQEIVINNLDEIIEHEKKNK